MNDIQIDATKFYQAFHRHLYQLGYLPSPNPGDFNNNCIPFIERAIDFVCDTPMHQPESEEEMIDSINERLLRLQWFLGCISNQVLGMYCRSNQTIDEFEIRWNLIPAIAMSARIDDQKLIDYVGIHLANGLDVCHDPAGFVFDRYSDIAAVFASMLLVPGILKNSHRGIFNDDD